MTTGLDGRYSISGLTPAQAVLTAQHQGHQNFSQTVTLVGATTVNIAMVPALAAAYAGNWAGQWRNTTFGSTGTITMTLTVNTIAQTFSMTIDFNGTVFGQPDPPPQTFNGSYTATGVSFTGVSTSYGTVTFNITPTGQITGNATNIPAPGISRVDFTGTATSQTVNINQTITFSGGGTAVGTITLTKQP